MSIALDAARGIAAQRQTIIQDDYDRNLYGHARNTLPALHDAHNRSADELETGPALAADLFASLYQRAPVLRAEAGIAPTHAINREIMQQVMATSEWGDVRHAGTVGDSLLAGIAAVTALKGAIASLDEDTRRRVNEHNETERAAEALFTEAETYDELAAARGRDDFAQRAAAARARAQQLRADADARAAELAAAGAQIGEAVRRGMRGALSSAAQEAAGIAAACATFGGDGIGFGPGANTPLSVKERIALARKVQRDPKLAQLAQICGRIMRIALSVQMARVDRAATEVTAIEVGRDLGRLLPSELLALDDADLEESFLRRFAEGSLLQYEITPKDRAGRGPIILACDESGSMSEQLGGEHTKELWSKAIALSLLGIARKQRRDFAYIGFASSGELWLAHHPNGEATTAQVIAIAEHFFGGGTDYEPWMGQALALAQSSAYNKADVILLSDGLAHVGPAMADAWHETRRAREMRCYAVMLAAHDSEAAHAVPVLSALSDGVITLDSFGADRGALEMVFAV